LVVAASQAGKALVRGRDTVLGTHRHFPTEQAAMKCLYLVIISLDPTGRGRKRWSNRWKAALNAFDITFDGRLSAAAS
jgi:transposase-like protein